MYQLHQEHQDLREKYKNTADRNVELLTQIHNNEEENMKLMSKNDSLRKDRDRFVLLLIVEFGKNR